MSQQSVEIETFTTKNIPLVEETAQKLSKPANGRNLSRKMPEGTEPGM